MRESVTKEVSKMVTNNWIMILFEGIIFLLLGIFAISQPYLMTLSVEFLLSVLLIAGGVIQGVRALTNLSDSRSLPVLIGSALALIAGILLLAYPMSGALTLTLLITVFLFLDGIVKIFSSFQYRPIQGWGLLLFSGFLSLLLAGLIFSQWPISASWVIGLYVGVYMLFLGISLITLSFYVKKIAAH